MNHILDELEDIEDPIKKQARAIEMITDPEIIECYVPIVIETPDEMSSHETDKLTEKGEPFFSALDDVFGQDPPEEYTSLKQMYEKDRDSLSILSTLKSGSHNLKAIKNIDFPPFHHTNFFLQHTGPKDPKTQDLLGKLQIHSSYSGKGGFAEVYECKVPDGDSLALKLYHPLCKIDEDEKQLWIAAKEQLFDNIEKHKKLFQKEFFLKPLITAEECCDWYIMEYMRGTEVRFALDKERGSLLKNKELCGRIFLTYAEMLKHFHDNKFVIFDCGWSNILFNDERVAVCDYESVCPVSKTKNDYEFTRFGRSIYVSQEHTLNRPYTIIGNLESYALMIDYFFNGPLLKNIQYVSDMSSDEYIHQCNEAENNDRGYLIERQKKLTPHLRDVVTALITYPRDELLNATDFIYAIKEDYNL